MPKVSVITPTWRRNPQTVRNCIGCVSYQSFQDWEHIICSDGSPEPAIVQLVQEQQDSRLVYRAMGSQRDHKTVDDYGSAVRTEMMKQASGEYLCFYDDDNIILPGYLARMAAALDRSPECGFAICQIVHMGPVQAFVGQPPVVLTGIPPKLYYIDTLQVMVRASLMKDKCRDQSRGGFYGDGTTFELLGEQHQWVDVPEMLGIRI